MVDRGVHIIGGRYGIGSKNVVPNQIIAVFDELRKPADQQKANFTVGITEDLTHSSLELGPSLDLVAPGTFQGKFWGFGSDGTVGANKSSCKIIGNHTDKYVQAYFDYDSKKSGGRTTSHLRFSDQPIKSTSLIEEPDFVSCSLQSYVYQYNVIAGIKPGGTFLLNTIWSEAELEEKLPAILKRELATKNVNFYTINAVKLAREVGLGGRTNTVLQAAFFKLSDIIPYDQAVEYMKSEAKKMYAKKSLEIVEKNWAAIDRATESLNKITVPAAWAKIEGVGLREFPSSSAVGTNSKQYIEKVLTPVLRQEGDTISVQEMIDSGMLDGTIPLGTAEIEKRSVSAYVPEWLPENCIACNQCSFVCPHAAIRPFLADQEEMKNAPAGYITKDLRGQDGIKYRIQVSIEDCTGCGL
jgi:pyruvate-ferredoxin/flavodoxin oxidoreductase